MSRREVEHLTLSLAESPETGDVIPGTGGFRKVRVASPDRNLGKRGAFRAITFYSGRAIPLFLITVFAKNEKSNLCAAECKALKAMGKVLVDGYAIRAGRVRSGR